MKKCIKFIAVMLIVFFVAIILKLIINNGTAQVEEVDYSIFSYDLWNNYPYERVHMADDLMSKVEFKKLTRDEVINLLGTKESVFSSDSITYTLGSKNKTIFTYFWYLKIIFDEKDNVIDVRLYED